jgi:eukaryotic-like serine/threonine-protein kinase
VGYQSGNRFTASPEDDCLGPVWSSPSSSSRAKGVNTAMDSKNQSNTDEPLTVQFAKLWETSLSTPDVFAFLSSHPDVVISERLKVLLLDQHLRWQRRQLLPLRLYLSAFPDIAARGEMVRALVDHERQERRRSMGRPDETLDAQPADLVSEAFTQRIEIESARDQTEADQVIPLQEPTTTGVPLGKENESPSTKSPSDPRLTEEKLSFELDETYNLRAEAKSLQAMLNAVRFTLVRRLGAGGMGVVYEAYDQQRGELVALKTMRRVDPLALVRFKHEFRALCDISHPNLVNLYELVAVEDRWFFTMELVEGIDFVGFVRSRPGAGRLFDEPRLRDALRQLAEGVDSLHQSAKLHRDIKPTNVLVTTEGRVVLLDFGLTADLASTGMHQSTDRQIVGTLAHMSPEQAAGRSITTASDWYSVGVMLFEALTGQLPFAGSPQEIIAAKQTQVPPSPETLAGDLPEDLVHLCNTLLNRDPARRPSAREILAQLRGTDQDSIDVPELNRSLPLIGRSRHRQVLDGVFSSINRGKTESVFVFGRTGTGKSTLIRSFLDERIEKDEAVVLFGRCYERESVPYKALDSLIDALAQYLKGLPTRETAAILPQDVAFLARVFPVLQSVEAVATARQAVSEMPDQQELRRRAFAGLRELLGGLAESVPLILAIDDLQWGDVDSALLLSDLICSFQSPALLFIGAFRSEDAERSPFLREINKSITNEPGRLDHRDLAVEPLTQSEARELALALLGRDDTVSRAQAHLVARESGGNPLFVDELVKHIQSGEPTERWDSIGQLDLDEVLWARIQRQPEEARHLLGTVAVSGRPIRQALAFHATDLGAGGRVALASLRSARLIRCAGLTQQDEIEIYHDRIRETVVAHLTPDQLQWHHQRLAALLAVSNQPDPEVLADHYRGAGDFRRACEFYSRGADQAAAALAFDRAARLYRIALQIHQPEADIRTQVLWKRLGDALANAGRGAEAAQAYLKAADTAPAAETLELKRLASTQLLISGQVDDGLTLLRSLLGPLGLSMPDTPRQALISLLWHRALLRLRGLSFRRRAEGQVRPLDLTRIDVCWSAVAGLSMVEPVRGADFQTRGLLLALRAGEPERLVRALAMEAAHQSTAGTAAVPRVATLLKTADHLAQQLDSPQARGMIELVRGISSFMLGRWKPAQTALDQAEHVFRNQCTGVTWERDTVHNLVLSALIQMGEMAEVKRRWTVLFRESRERGDLYATSRLTTFYMTMIQLAGNQLIDSDTEIELESAVNHPKGGRFNLEHAAAFDSLMYLNLYRGDITSAWVRINRIWPEYSRSMLLRIQMVRINLLELRARTAVAMAEKDTERANCIQQAKQDAQALEKEGQPWALAHACYVRAAIAGCEEDSGHAIEHLKMAAEKYDTAEMPLRAQILRYRLGEVEEGAESRELRENAERWIRGQGIVSPERWAGMYAPGFGLISKGSLETSY